MMRKMIQEECDRMSPCFQRFVMTRKDNDEEEEEHDSA